MSSAAATTSLDPPVSSEAAPVKAQLPAAWHLASGAVSGAASVFMLQPLDLIKTRVQQDPAPPVASTSRAIGTSGGAAVLQPEAPAVAKAQRARIWTTTKDVVRTDGLRGLWRGTVPTLYRNVPGVSLYFLSLSRLRTFMGNTTLFRPKGAPLPAPGTKAKLTPVGDLLVGSTARTAVGFVLTPFTLLKTISESTLSLPNSSSSRTAKPSTFTALRTLYATGGIRSLWRGAVPTALRDAPGAGLFIVFYERGRRIIGVAGDGGKGAVGGGVAGAAASLASTLLTTPFDVLKTRRQLSPQNYTSLLSSAALVYRTSGIRGFWEGGALRVCRKAGSAGIGWAVYEAFVGVGEGRRAVAAGGKDRSGGG
ncbi:mitochondrial carrier domain-containing protein [Rhodotorula diobovata]|uniref:Mitochondrial carrier domain-containing protein n=1 Tax=Rhodotorula diobovata TaxID=5288 RepID=A0A5C5FS91_9BASI|nr:mitochondrial carrier domain-containing protein [Rhodotorula diobovata]